jgi:hypothetical protein
MAPGTAARALVSEGIIESGVAAGSQPYRSFASILRTTNSESAR